MNPRKTRYLQSAVDDEDFKFGKFSTGGRTQADFFSVGDDQMKEGNVRK